jgi:hypothetical protein
VAGSVWAPRTGAKLKAILIPPRRDEGASGPQIAEAMGWALHTVRGFLAGLAKKGITAEVMVFARLGQTRPAPRAAILSIRSSGRPSHER